MLVVDTFLIPQPVWREPKFHFPSDNDQVSCSTSFSDHVGVYSQWELNYLDSPTKEDF